MHQRRPHAARGAIDVTARSGLQPEEVVLRFGLHWGATLYVGNITTGGRAEVTALGDEVNEAARIEACATGGLALASKDLVERLEPEDAEALGLDPDRITYTPLGDLPPRPTKPAATHPPSPSARSDVAGALLGEPSSLPMRAWIPGETPPAWASVQECTQSRTVAFRPMRASADTRLA